MSTGQSLRIKSNKIDHGSVVENLTSHDKIQQNRSWLSGREFDQSPIHKIDHGSVAENLTSHLYKIDHEFDQSPI